MKTNCCVASRRIPKRSLVNWQLHSDVVIPPWYTIATILATTESSLDWSPTVSPIPKNSPKWTFISLYSPVCTARSLSRIWRLEMIAGSFLITSPNTVSGSSTEINHQLFRSPTITHIGFSSVLPCCLWDARGIMYWELLLQDTMVTASMYTHQLKKLLQTTRENRPKSENAHLLHGGNRPHDAIELQQILTNLDWKTVPHPLYSPYLALSNNTLFHSLKQFLVSK